jgi:hypothetical protein
MTRRLPFGYFGPPSWLHVLDRLRRVLLESGWDSKVPDLFARHLCAENLAYALSELWCKSAWVARAWRLCQPNEAQLGHVLEDSIRELLQHAADVAAIAPDLERVLNAERTWAQRGPQHFRERPPLPGKVPHEQGGGDGDPMAVLLSHMAAVRRTLVRIARAGRQPGREEMFGLMQRSCGICECCLTILRELEAP